MAGSHASKARASRGQGHARRQMELSRPQYHGAMHGQLKPASARPESRGPGRSEVRDLAEVETWQDLELAGPRSTETWLDLDLAGPRPGWTSLPWDSHRPAPSSRAACLYCRFGMGPSQQGNPGLWANKHEHDCPACTQHVHMQAYARGVFLWFSDDHRGVGY